MKLLLLAVLAVYTVSALPVHSKDDILGGALCLPCVELIKDVLGWLGHFYTLEAEGEQNTEGDFDTWFDKESKALCSPLGSIAKLCVKYFHQYETDFNNFINNKADPKKSCISIDFCN